MRYLNKIIFINSASVKYTEIELDGNVHLIGTQGVGKSTLLRAILFFYNTNKTKLGIPREKKGFDDYYFEFQNSYIIYEIIKDTIPYCVLAYKFNGKVAFRFFNSAYKRELFIDENNRAFESWEKIRNAFGREVHYSSLVTSYEEFRKIIYGDNKGLKPDFRKYALIESKQFQNIPRTIQNVFLNTNLEAKFIKDTIIKSLNEDEFIIDIENYSKNHLRDFETQINDIRIWFKENKKGQIIIRDQAHKVIDKYRIRNLLRREKKVLAIELASRIEFIRRKKPILDSDHIRKNEVLIKFWNQREKLNEIHKKREQKLISEIDYIKKELSKAKDKQAEYSNLDIDQIIQKVYRKDALTNELKALEEEKQLLTSKFSELNQKYEALIAQSQNQNQEFANQKTAEINNLNSSFADTKTTILSNYQEIINQINKDNKAEKEKAIHTLNTISDNENKVKNKKSELKHQTFFIQDIENCKDAKKKFEVNIAKSKSTILDSKNQITTTRKEGEFEAKEVQRDFQMVLDQQTEKNQKLSEKIQKIENKINQSKVSLYGWLNDKYPNWENSVGKVIDEENVLFNTELNPKLVDLKTTSLFGIELNLNSLSSRVKTVKEYNQEVSDYKKQIAAIQNKIHQLSSEKDHNLQKLKIKFGKKINIYQDAISENEYIISQNENKLKKNKVELDQWIEKSEQEKDALLRQLENNLEEFASEKLKEQINLDSIKNGIKRKITLKENERNAELENLEKVKNDKVTVLKASILANNTATAKRIQELKEKQTKELDHKGADTKRLSVIDGRLEEIQKGLAFIKENERLVIEYEKDKRELFDSVPKLKANKVSEEKKQEIITDEHKIEMNKMNHKCSKQEDAVKIIKSDIAEFDSDLDKYEAFKISDTFSSIQKYLLAEVKELEYTKTAVSVIAEINSNYYREMDTFKELQQATNTFIGNFGEQNIFSFRVKLNEDDDYLNFASDLKEFIEEDKIVEFEKRVNERFANIIHLIGRETTELNSKEAEIEKIIRKINNDFVTKNFVQAIKEMEMRTKESSNPIVKLLVQIKDFNDENSLVMGETNLFTTSDRNSKNQKAIDLLKKLIEEIEKTKSSTLTLSESFDLQFRIVENDNDSGWVEKLSNVGSEGTDVLVKAMINILLLNVFKDNASRNFKDFKLHCMMDEIGRLHPNNVSGILRFANERNILLINGSPTSQNATDYKYTYKLAKEPSKIDTKKYITKINKLVKVNAKVLN
ncbi:ATP-binding protein [Flavobacterium crassostreae]|uniref:DNA-binding protein n=1 Tax=Flavobacterium crassostreae TaxID=1763534 RepID=A0A1B9DJK8_9FLAO|nr:ATP-binding protein [Flavobacterium crassostreae]OCB69890.1 DNA-binding protein [Flavobacterium crassostreae]